MIRCWKRFRFAAVALVVVTAVGALCGSACAGAPAEASAADDGAAVVDPVAQLLWRLDHHTARLTFEPSHGFLASLLHELAVPVESQSLVFSKTSVQAPLISPRSPRAIYFNDDVYVGWVRGGAMLEIAAVDPRQGPVFYQLPNRDAERPHFVRETRSCVQCHQPGENELPTLLMRSVFPDSQGMPVFRAGTFATTDQSSFKQRWGGWYVDGKLGGLTSMANGFSDDAAHPDRLTPQDFVGAFDSDAYLTPHSDVVALLLLAHQTNVHNLMTRAADATGRALQQQAAIDQMEGKMSNPPKGTATKLSDSARSWIESACEPLVKAMLFSGEEFAVPVVGSTDLARTFASRGPRDVQQRSLRDCDLHHRLFRYPCSYLIYSQQFEQLPDAARQQVYRRLWEILTGRDDSAAFSHLTEADRTAIYGILLETKPHLPSYWKKRRA